MQRNPHELKRRLLLAQNKDGESVWHMAAAGGHLELLEKLWGWAKDKLNTHYLKSVLFLTEDSCNFSTWCYAIREVRTDVIHTRSVRKVSDRIFLCEHLMDYKLARLHEPTLNLSAHA